MSQEKVIYFESDGEYAEDASLQSAEFDEYVKLHWRSALSYIHTLVRDKKEAKAVLEEVKRKFDLMTKDDVKKAADVEVVPNRPFYFKDAYTLRELSPHNFEQFAAAGGALYREVYPTKEDTAKIREARSKVDVRKKKSAEAKRLREIEKAKKVLERLTASVDGKPSITGSYA